MHLKSDTYSHSQKALSWREYKELKTVIDNIEDELLIDLAVTTGIRREDICAIKIANIDLDEGTLTFHESKKKRDRTIPLEPAVVLLIRKYLKTIPRRKELFPFVGRTAYRRLKKWCLRAGIPTRPFHSMRGTCYKFCKKMGRTTQEAARLIGDSISVAERHYGQPSWDEMSQAAKEKAITG